MSHPRAAVRVQNSLLVLQLAGDALMCYAGLALSFWVRFHTPLRQVGIESGGVSFSDYQPLMALGTLFLVLTYAYLKVYDARLLLRPWRSTGFIFNATCFWVIAFLGASLVLKFEPSISRLFVAIAGLTNLTAMVAWRFVFFYGISRSHFRDKLVQRLVIIGWNDDAGRLLEAVHTDRNHPYEVYGVVHTQANDTATRPFHYGLRVLGHIDQLDAILAEHPIDIAVVADLELNKAQLFQAVSLCERHYVHFKVIPSFFQIFVSNLRMQTVSGVPLLGIESLPIARVPNQIVKRAVDIVGALVGLTFSLPIMAVLGIMIRRESPGPIIYRQVRTGLHGRPFTIYKLRSMKLDAEQKGAQWAVAGDDRRLTIGAFMRETNLDEIPQFWNVLKGDMSLVGPRPERPELIANFEREIPHYNPRHEVRPGLTGWAQINGLRGNTSLVDRVKYDLYYIENWTFWFDIQIMLLTFFRRQNAY